MRILSPLLILFLAATCTEKGHEPTGAFYHSHVVVQGDVVDQASGQPVVGATIALGLRADNCSRPPQPFSSTTNSQGNFKETLETLEIPSEVACLTIEVTPPNGSSLQGTTVTIDQVHVVRTSSPPDTVRVSITLAG